MILAKLPRQVVVAVEYGYLIEDTASALEPLRITGLLRSRRQSHPRRIPGFLTVPQLTAKLGLERSWIYDRIHNGTIQVAFANAFALPV